MTPQRDMVNTTLEMVTYTLEIKKIINLRGKENTLGISLKLKS